MAYELVDTQNKVSIVAGADLSALQYTFVKLNSSGAVVAVSAIGDVVLGVLQNAPTSGKIAEVTVHGVTKIKASAAITLPAVLGTTTAGKSVKVTQVTGGASGAYTKTVIGQALTPASADGNIHTAFISSLPLLGA